MEISNEVLVVESNRLCKWRDGLGNKLGDECIVLCGLLSFLFVVAVVLVVKVEEAQTNLNRSKH